MTEPVYAQVAAKMGVDLPTGDGPPPTVILPPPPVDIPTPVVRPGVEHAKNEIGLINLANTLQAKVMAMVEAFDDNFGDESDVERRATADMLHSLFVRKNLSPLTDNPDEWEQVTPTLWQNKRDDEAFSNNGGLIHWFGPERRDNNTFPMYMSQHYDAPPKETSDANPTV